MTWQIQIPITNEHCPVRYMSVDQKWRCGDRLRLPGEKLCVESECPIKIKEDQDGTINRPA